MNYVLDTSILIDMKRGNPAVTHALRQLLGRSLRTPSISLFTYSEYYLGSIKQGKQEEASNYLNKFVHLNFTISSARLFSELMYKYRSKGIVFDTLDLLNASIAMAENMTFVTSDRQFDKISELKKIVIRK